MRFTDRNERRYDCRNCGREFPQSQLDDRRWCRLCRRELIRRSALVGRIVGILGALIMMTWVFANIGSQPRFVVGWVALVVAIYFFLSKLTTRVAFEVLRGRGVPAPPEE